ncbi:MAG TPA: hypothetical protein VGD59_14725 [Acidisarcina sp.]
MAFSQAKHEEETIRAFMPKDKQERYLFLLAHPSRRRRFTSSLAHFHYDLFRNASPIPPSLAHTHEEVIALLQSKGAGTVVWVISENSRLDATEMPLKEAVREVWGSDTGTILSCVPGRLALFQGEERNSARLLHIP